MAFLDSSGVTRLWQHIIAKLGNKVDKETGKGLSTNDYTTTEKNKLAGIAEGANNYTLPAASSTLGGVKTTNTDGLDLLTANGYAPIPIVDGIPYYMPVSVLENNGFPYLTVGNLDLNLPIAMSVGSDTKPVYFLDGYPYETTYTLEASVPANAKFTDTTYTAGNSGIAISAQKIYNKGILSLSQGTTNGTIKYSFFNQQVNNVVTSDLKIKGLDTAAYHPESYFVPATRTINNKALSANISLTASDVGAAASSHTHSYLPLTGGTLTGYLTLQNNDTYPRLFFKSSSYDGSQGEMFYYMPNNAASSYFHFRQFCRSSEDYSLLSTYEDFKLPQTTADRTSNGYYNILTTKSAVTVAQGGTGATTAADARTNLGITPANIGAASSTLVRGQMKTFTIAGDKDHYYPVVFNVDSEYFVNRIAITRYYNDTAPDDWGTDTNHKGGLTFQFQWNGDSTWGGNGTSTSLKVETLIEIYCKMVGGMKLSTSGVVVWLRGGSALYKVLNEMGSAMSITPYYNTFTDDAGNSFPVRTYDASVVDSEIQQRLVFYPLTGGNLLGKLYASEEISGTRLYSKTNIYPGVYFKNAAGMKLAEFYVNTTSGEYAATKIRAYSSASSYYDFQFLGNGTFNCATLAPSNALGIAYGGTGATTASGALTNLGALPLTGGTLTGNLGVNGIITAKTYLAVERNSNPQLALKNANSNPLAVLYTETSDGSYGNTHLQVYKSATESTAFTFGNTGNFRAYGNIYGSTLQVDGANNWPSLWFKCSSKTNPGVLLQTNELHGFGIYCYGSDLDTATTRYFEGYTFPAPATGLTVNKTYTVYSEKNIIYSSSQPTGVKGAIWLKPV